MKYIFFVALAVIFAAPTVRAQGSHYVAGYYRRDGSFVPGHYQSGADGNFYNNWSTRGNFNPYTGQPGYNSQPPARPWVPQRRGYYDAYGIWHPSR